MLLTFLTWRRSDTAKMRSSSRGSSSELPKECGLFRPSAGGLVGTGCELKLGLRYNFTAREPVCGSPPPAVGYSHPIPALSDTAVGFYDVEPANVRPPAPATATRWDRPPPGSRRGPGALGCSSQVIGLKKRYPDCPFPALPLQADPGRSEPHCRHKIASSGHPLRRAADAQPAASSHPLQLARRPAVPILRNARSKTAEPVDSLLPTK